MVTSQDILKKTKLKSSKTLTRWGHLGLIPKPTIQMHPSGRGKMAYWPDWVLERCMEIKKLQQEGFSLHSVFMQLELDRVTKNEKKFDDFLRGSNSFVENEKKFDNFLRDYNSLAEQEVNFGNGRKMSLVDMFHAIILKALENLCPDKKLLPLVHSQLKEKKSLDTIMLFLNSGFNPILVFDGQTLEILPDFLLSHRMADESPTQKPYIMVPVLPAVRKTCSILGKEFLSQPQTFPAPKVWSKQGDTMMEYQVYLLGGEPGFELIRESAETVGTISSKFKKLHSRQEPE